MGAEITTKDKHIHKHRGDPGASIQPRAGYLPHNTFPPHKVLTFPLPPPPPCLPKGLTSPSKSGFLAGSSGGRLQRWELIGVGGTMVVVYSCVYKAGSFPREGTGWGLSLGAPQGPAGHWQGQWVAAPGTAPPTPEYVLCFLEWGPLFVSTPTTDGSGGLLAHLQAGGPHTQTHMQGPSARQGQCTLQVWVQVFPPRLSVAPCLLSTQRQMQGLANSHPVPQPRLHEHWSCICPRSRHGRHPSFPPLPLAHSGCTSKGGVMEGSAGQGRGNPEPSEGSAPWTGMALLAKQRWEVGGGERGACGRGWETHK